VHAFVGLAQRKQSYKKFVNKLSFYQVFYSHHLHSPLVNKKNGAYFRAGNKKGPVRTPGRRCLKKP
jgi:hypothetical protein